MISIKIKYLFSIFGIALLFNSCGNNYFPQFYEFPRLSSSEKLMDTVKYFKKNYPEYKLVRLASDGVYGEQPDSENEHSYGLFFYFPDSDQTVHCIVFKNPVDNVSIGVRGITEGRDFAGWKRINTKDFTRKEEALIKQKFEKEILNRLRCRWKRVDDSEWLKRFVSGF
jgi:hypothetical protein